jgi:coenzyme F420-0:L-glutamate ligase / coenzyme F420-1:gamma-L-glutamate ligase
VSALVLPGFLEARRSIRAFTDDPVDDATLDALVAAACIAPAPHHSRPWRFATITTDASKRALAHGMGERWRADLAGDGVGAARVDELVDASHAKIIGGR